MNNRFFLALSFITFLASVTAFRVDMPIISWGGLAFIGGVLFILGLGSDQP